MLFLWKFNQPIQSNYSTEISVVSKAHELFFKWAGNFEIYITSLLVSYDYYRNNRQKDFSTSTTIYLQVHLCIYLFSKYLPNNFTKNNGRNNQYGMYWFDSRLFIHSTNNPSQLTVSASRTVKGDCWAKSLGFQAQKLSCYAVTNKGGKHFNVFLMILLIGNKYVMKYFCFVNIQVTM